MKTMRKCNEEMYQLAKDQALVKMLKKIAIRRRQCPNIQQKNEWTQK
jgi:hypothetical protein